MLLTILLQVAASAGIAKIGGALGAALSTLGAAWGIGHIGGHAMEAIARQPEAAGDIRANMVVVAAFIEGVALFSVIVALLAVL